MSYNFLSVQRESCGGTSNITAYTYDCNINGSLASSTKLVTKRQTNVFETDDVELGEQPDGLSSLPKWDNVFSKHLWSVNI